MLFNSRAADLARPCQHLMFLIYWAQCLTQYFQALTVHILLDLAHIPTILIKFTTTGIWTQDLSVLHPVCYHLGSEPLTYCTHLLVVKAESKTRLTYWASREQMRMRTRHWQKWVSFQLDAADHLSLPVLKDKQDQINTSFMIL